MGKQSGSQETGKTKHHLVLRMSVEQSSALQAGKMAGGEAGRGNTISVLPQKHI